MVTEWLSNIKTRVKQKTTFSRMTMKCAMKNNIDIIHLENKTTR